MLFRKKSPRLIIIDGLDECFPGVATGDTETHFGFRTTAVYFHIASRPHPDIRDTFNSNILRDCTHTIPLEHDYQSTKDIRHFLSSIFHTIRSKRTYLLTARPQADRLEALVQKSSGQFIYAATVIRYVAAGRRGHEIRLKTALDIRPPENKDAPFAMLDALYLQIFRSVGEDEIGKVMELLGALIHIKDIDNKMDNLADLETFFRYGAYSSTLAHLPMCIMSA
jgi:hypothetical protein